MLYWNQNAFNAFSIETKSTLDHCLKSICECSQLFSFPLWSLKSCNFFWKHCGEYKFIIINRDALKGFYFYVLSAAETNPFFGFLWDPCSYLLAYAISIKAREVVHVDMKGARNGQINNYMITRQKPRSRSLWLFNVMWPHWSSLLMGPKAGRGV